MKRQSGFTLLELLVTLLIVGVLLSLGVPSFNTMIQNNRLSTTANDISIALNLARSESIKRGVQINVTQAGGGWTNGSTVELTDGTDLRVFPGSSGSITITGSVTQIGYMPTGMATTAATFSICDSSRSGETGRRITVNITGRISISNLTCS